MINHNDPRYLREVITQIVKKTDPHAEFRAEYAKQVKDGNMLTPTQIAKWRKEFVDFGWSAYLRVKTEQATEIAELKDYKKWYEEAISASNVAGYAGVSATQTIEHQDSEIAELKAKLEQVMPLAKFCAYLMTNGYSEHDDEAAYGLRETGKTLFPNIEATIEQLLKD